MARGTYNVHGDGQTVATAITLLQLTAPATAILYVTRWAISQSSVTTSTEARIRLLRKSAGITGTAAPPTPNPKGAETASGVVAAWLATVEGTDGVILDEYPFNYLTGYEWVAARDRDKWIVPPSGIVALKFPAAPTSAAFTFAITYEEEG